ncbi:MULTISPECIES: TnsA-like heteromeric transposase endonuclease subunit [unclassified Streptomyces]|uniref:TnsA-like heteromeric transposase endonuclease subunit n=1 Tax=Streptomyces sp. NPDC127129 TaxID=3345373 RepID=UPI00363DB3F0
MEVFPLRDGGAGVPGRFEARIVDAGGRVRPLPWPQVAGQVVLEEAAAVRTFPARRGRRVAPGWWWSATTGRLVHYGFGAMRTQVMLLDHDPQVVALACSPVELAWLGHDGQPACHTPHMMARLADGSGLLVDCAGHDGVSERIAGYAPVVAAAAQAVGWRHRIAAVPDRIFAANVRWLAGFRHPRNAQPGRMEEVAACFARPRPLVEGVRRLGDPIAVWPAVFHALWSGALSASLDRPLHERVVAVSVRPGLVVSA